MDPRRKRTAEALIAAAEEVFAQRDLDDVSVEEIARHAGVAVSSIYNHFGSKSGLHAAVVERALDIDRERMDAAYTADRSPIEQLRAAAEEYLRFALEHPEHFRMLAWPPKPGRNEAAQRTADELARRCAEQNARMSDTIKRGIETGDFRPVDPDAVATALWAAWNGIIGLAWRPDALGRDPEELRALLAVATNLVERGLHAPSN